MIERITVAVAATTAVASVWSIAAADAKPAIAKTFTLRLAGRVEVPPGSPHGSGTAVLTLNASKRTVCYRFTVHGIDQPQAAHIHVGRAGTAGNVVVVLFGGPGHLRGCARGVSRNLIAAILRRPTAYYVNVHTARYPNGALRSQL